MIFALLVSAALAQGEPRLLLGPAPLPLDAPTSILAVQDVDGDGSLDLMASHATRSIISVLPGRAGGMPGPAKTHNVGLAPGEMAAGNLNADAFADLVVVNQVEATASVLLGTGGADFEASCSFATDPQPEKLALADLDGDGDLDLAVASSRPSLGLQVFWGDGQGTCRFAPGPRRALAGRVLQLRARDDAGGMALAADHADGATICRTLLRAAAGELAVAESRTGSLPEPVRAVAGNAVLAGEGLLVLKDGARQSLTAVPLSSVSPPAAAFSGQLAEIDADGDGVEDVTALLEREGVSWLRIHKGMGGGEFSAAHDVGLGLRSATALAWGDLDADAIADAAIARAGSKTAIVARGRSGGELELGRLQPLGQTPDRLHARFWDADGNLDLFARSGTTIQYLRGDGLGGFDPPVLSGLPAIPGPFGGAQGYGDLLFLDYDGDAIEDLALHTVVPGHFPPEVVGGRGEVVVSYLDASGTIIDAVRFAISDRPSAIAGADMNQDGFDDLVAADSRLPGLNILWGSSTRFGPSTAIDAGEPQFAVEAADMDDDGALDIVAALGRRIDVFFGDGLGEFPERLELAPVAGAVELRLLDLDQDGRVDLAARTSSDEVVLVRRSNEGALEPEAITAGPSLRAFEVVPRGDGGLDLFLLAGLPRALTVMPRPAGGAGAPQGYWVGPDPRALEVADVDSDARPDALIGDGEAGGLLLLRGSEPGAPATFRRGDVDGDARVLVTDAIRLLGWLFGGGELLACPDAADANDDGEINLTDALRILLHLFQGAQPPALPGPAACGSEASPDALAPCRSACR